MVTHFVLIVYFSAFISYRFVWDGGWFARQPVASLPPLAPRQGNQDHGRHATLYPNLLEMHADLGRMQSSSTI